jgi:hypothetical protein
MTSGGAVLVAVGAVALTLASSAGSGIAVDGVFPSRVRHGEVVHVRISSGLRLWQRIPLYIVPSTKALRPRPCGRGICEPKVTGALPRAYVRVGRVSFRKRLHQIVSFTLPVVEPGRYEMAFYCGVCYRGRAGSLIASPENAFTVASG